MSIALLYVADKAYAQYYQGQTQVLPTAPNAGYPAGPTPHVYRAPAPAPASAPGYPTAAPTGSVYQTQVLPPASSGFYPVAPGASPAPTAKPKPKKKKKKKKEEEKFIEVKKPDKYIISVFIGDKPFHSKLIVVEEGSEIQKAMHD